MENKKTKIGWMCLLLFFSTTTLFGQKFQLADAYLYLFPEHENRLLADYGDNASELQRMRQGLEETRVSLLEGESHLLIVAHVASWQCMEASTINEASLRANRLRVYIKTKLKLPNECVAFYIDRSGRESDRVHIYRVSAPLPRFANQEICYSDSLYPKSMKEAMKHYGAIPYVDQHERTSCEEGERLIYRISDALFEPDELEDYRLLVNTKPQKQRAEPPVSKDTTLIALPTVLPLPTVEPLQAVASRRARPFNLAVKTNLLPWCGLAPSVLLGNGSTSFQRGSFMPNLELEYCFGSRWSVDVGFLYSYFTYGDRPENLWGVSSVMFEPRVWLLGDGRFRWMWLGAFGRYGDFDVRGEKINAEGLYGRTGQFLATGLSVGCLVPLGAGFALEGVVQGGYYSVFDGEKYIRDSESKKNYRESIFSVTGGIIGFRLNLVYRFGI